MAKGNWQAALLIGLLVISGLVFAIRKTLDQREPLTQRQVATRVLAEYLKEKIGPQKVLVIGNPFSQINRQRSEVIAFQKASEKGLREGFGDGVELKLVYPRIKPEALKDPSSVYIDPETKTPLSFLTTENAWDEIIKANPDADLAVSLVGLPLSYRKMVQEGAFSKTRLALLLPDWRMVGGAAEIRREFQSGRIVAAVIAQPGADPAAKVSGNYKQEFDRLFSLVTASDVEKLFQTP